MPIFAGIGFGALYKIMSSLMVTVDNNLKQVSFGLWRDPLPIQFQKIISISWESATSPREHLWCLLQEKQWLACHMTLEEQWSIACGQEKKVVYVGVITGQTHWLTDILM